MIKKTMCVATLALVLCLGCFPTMNTLGHSWLVKDPAVVDLDSSITRNLHSSEIPTAAEASSTSLRDYWPTTGWRYSTAEDQGMNSTKLEEMMEHIRNQSLMLDSVVVVRNGYVVLEEYPRPTFCNQNTTHNLYSCTKSITSMLIGIALGEGYIDNVQQKLVDFFPNRSVANMDSRKQAVTLENVLTMTSGLQWDEWIYSYDDPRNSVRRMISTLDWVQFVLDQPMANEPGTVWTYNSGGSHLLAAILNETTGTNPWTFARDQLLGPLGITIGYWRTDYRGLSTGHSDLHLRPLDMAKLGFLYLNKGIWGGEQIVPTEWVEASTETHFSLFEEWGYGYQWWIQPSAGLYWAWGMAGQTIAVIPDYDMVVVFTGSVTDYDPGHYLIENYILPSATAPPIVVPDDSPTIQEAINNATDGDTVFVKAGTYYEHVVVNKTVALVGEDASTTIIDGNSTGHVISVVRDNVNITGFTVQRSGNIHVPELEAGICLNRTTGCNISGNNIIDNGFAGVSLLDSQQNTVVANNVSRSGWGGIHLMNSSRNTVSGNILDSNGQQHQWGGGINGHVASNYNNITDNVIMNTVHGMFYHASAYNNICRNNISEIAAEGIWLQDQVNYNVVTENNLVNCRTALWLQGPNYNNTLSGNFIAGAQYGIRVTNAQNVNIVGNVIVDSQAGSDSWRAGIRLEGGARAQVNYNVITGNNYAILLYSNSPYVSVLGNNLTDNEFGVRVASGGSNYVTISNNFVANNRGYGVGVTGFSSGSDYAVISGNTIINNSDGIALGQYSNQNTITFNNVSHNAIGFYIEHSTQNLIYGNSIVNNSLQAYVGSGSVNTWDGGYAEGGNVWSDHFSWDIFSGPYQNETGNDGIGDAPYEIDENNIDHYPYVPYRLPADTNNDDYVGIDDLFLIATNFGKEKGQPSWNPLYDINSDNHVNIEDIFIAACYFGDSI